MKKYTMVRYVLLFLALLFCGGWTSWSIERELWMSLAVSLSAFAMTAAFTYNTFRAPLRAIHHYILNKYQPGRPPLSISPTSSFIDIYATERMLARLMANYRTQVFEEMGRQQFYELVLRQVETGVVACSKAGKVEWMNRCAEEQLGVLKHIPENWMDNREEAERVVHLEHHNHRRECLLTRIPFREAEEDKLLFTLRDIRHVLETKQQESWKSLSRVLTHEIMNSMTPILSLADTLASRTDEADASDTATVLQLRQGLEVIRRRSRGLMDFVDNYRRLTRVPPPQQERIGADDLFNNQRKLFPASHINFEQPYRNFCFRADRTQLEQVLINLIKNALEATEQPESPVSITLNRNVEQHEICIHIQDHGRGIAAKNWNTSSCRSIPPSQTAAVLA